MFMRNHTADDYQTFCQWWDAWGWPHIPYVFLPVNSLVVCNDEGKPLCAVFLYRTDTPIIWAENYISDKDDAERSAALSLLIQSIAVRAAELGGSAVMSAVSHNGLARRLRKAGFNASDTGLTNYILAV